MCVFVHISEHMLTPWSPCYRRFWLSWTLVKNWCAEAYSSISMSSVSLQWATCSSREEIWSWYLVSVNTLWVLLSIWTDWVNKWRLRRCDQRELIERHGRHTSCLTTPCSFNDRAGTWNAWKIIWLTNIYTHISKFTRSVMHWTSIQNSAIRHLGD